MSTPKNLRLSVLDQSPVRKHGSAQQAIKETVSLAQMTEKWGYTRFWVSEHHNTRALAGSTPEVLIAHLAAQTKRIRLGSGGVMLPHYSALKVAENFKMLETLYPGRIDLGLGRAPGTDRLTAAALNPYNDFNEAAFMQQLKDLGHYLHDTFEPGDVTEKIRATPVAPSVPPVWMLSSSGQSGLFAAHFGFAFSFAHFINPVGGPKMVQAYKDHFESSAFLQEPAANVGVFVLCADTAEKAQELQSTMDLLMLRIEKGISAGVPPYEDVQKQQYSEAEQQRISFNRQRVVSGTKEQVKQQLEALAAQYGVEELVVVTITHSFEDRLRSYELLAEAFELEEQSVAATAT
ncbi:LLM class flavin-dependent oxidoreductase [Pontibacter actiniarum]|uniref:Luciferase-like monooxygenase n=1 Tax=Pontibacter actiniarum TaxID=323450 RepID=A0A1X9YXE5_9BACT|nr:LLM class flavin-dependent oxidoreductase [Pontibacter actiniarum]ARS37607.1 LLM class flavin-dependent oxidoreductase [Pontibacter actiniarum]